MSCTLDCKQCCNIQVLFHAPFEQWDLFRLWMHSQPDRFSHIACRHLSLCSYCQETLSHKLSKPNEYSVHTSFILEKGKKRDVENNLINNYCLHHVMIRIARGTLETTMKKRVINNHFGKQCCFSLRPWREQWGLWGLVTMGLHGQGGLRELLGTHESRVSKLCSPTLGYTCPESDKTWALECSSKWPQIKTWRTRSHRVKRVPVPDSLGVI